MAGNSDSGRRWNISRSSFIVVDYFYFVNIQFTLFCCKSKYVIIYTFFEYKKILKNLVHVKFVPNSMSGLS